MQEVSEPFLAYRNAKNDLLYNISFTNYSNIIKQRFNNNNSAVEDYLNFARTFINNDDFLAAFNKTIDTLQFPDLTNQQMFIPALQQSLIRNVDNYQKLTEQITSSIQSIITVLGMTGLDDIMPGTDAYNALVQLFGNDEQKVNRIITENKHLQLENTFKGQYRAMISKLPDFLDIVESPGSDIDKTFRLLARMLMPIQTLIGICSEYQVEYEFEQLLNNFQKNFHNDNIKISRVGDEADPGFRVGTADLAVSLGANPQVSFNVPNLGMSLKRSHKNLDTAKEVNIKLKGSTYGGLMQDIDPGLVTAFYTLYANTQPTVNGKKQGAIPSGALTSAYNQMKAQMLVTALIGSKDSPNLVFILVINNRAYTIFDLLQTLRDEVYHDTSSVLLKPAFRSMRRSIGDKHQALFDSYNIKQKEQRSAKIRSFIDRISAAMELKLTMSLLNKI